MIRQRISSGRNNGGGAVVASKRRFDRSADERWRGDHGREQGSRSQDQERLL